MWSALTELIEGGYTGQLCGGRAKRARMFVKRKLPFLGELVVGNLYSKEFSSENNYEALGGARNFGKMAKMANWF